LERIPVLEKYNRVQDKVDSVWINVLKGAPPTTEDNQLPERLAVSPTGFVLKDNIADRSFIVVPDEGESTMRNALPHRDRENPISIEPTPVGPKLLQVQTDVRSDGVEFSSPYGTVLVETDEPDKGGPVYEVAIQKKDLVAFDQGDDAAKLFSSLLGRHVRLARIDPARPSRLPQEYHQDASPNVATGVDSAPIVQASIADVFTLQNENGLKRDPSVLWERFRVGVVLSGFAIAEAARERDPMPHRYGLSEDLVDRLVFLDKERRREFGVRVLESTQRVCYYPNINPKTYVMDNYGTTLMKGRYGYGTNATGQKRKQHGYLFTSRLSLNTVADDEPPTIGEGDLVEVASWLDQSRVILP
jgi:hypothetical protein